jgi:hypothetical protein
VAQPGMDIPLNETRDFTSSPLLRFSRTTTAKSTSLRLSISLSF